MSIFDDIYVTDNESPIDHIYQGLKETFSQHCDAILHGFTCHLFGNDNTITEGCRYLEQKGCYIPDFYMINPFYYLGFKNAASHAVVKNGVIFIWLRGDEDDMDNFRITVSEDISVESMESMPVVLFRGFRKPIGLNGACDDWKDDLSEKLHCKQDTCEFSGVFKAELKGQNKGQNVYRMTKIFDRYYFDDTKIK